mmetsp:Transcript_36187/g.91073  ORF Transcript_36187/g.91073 Transcript_36187/m.91073 type:complete len:238 (-) Transcript_36187:1140-1853(-)
MVQTHRHELLPIRAEGHLLDRPGVARSSGDLSALVDIPDLDYKACARRGKEAVIGREADAVEFLVHLVDPNGVCNPEVPLAQRALLASGVHRGLVRRHGQAIDASVSLTVGREPLLLAEIPGQQAAVPAARDGVLVVWKQHNLVDPRRVLLQMRHHVLRLQLPDADLAFRAARHDEADVGGELDRRHATLVRIVDVPQVLALHTVERHQAPIIAPRDHDVLCACHRGWIGPSPDRAP